MKFDTKRTWQYPPYLRHCYCTNLENKKSFFADIQQIWKKTQTILIFSVFKIWSLSPYRLQIKFSMSLFFYLFTMVINMWHQEFVTADVIAVFVNKPHGIQRWKQDFLKKFVFKEVHSKEVDRQISWKKAGQSMVLMSCWKTCGTQTQLT